MKILITGVAGFLGNWLARIGLDQGHQVGGIDNMGPGSAPYRLKDIISQITFWHADLADEWTLKIILQDQPWDIVIHTASLTQVDESFLNPSLYVHNQVTCTTNLLEAIRTVTYCPVVIHISTDEVYGPRTNQENHFTEDSSISPKNPYAYSKWMQEQIIRCYHENFGIPFVILRLCNLFGFGQLPNKFIPAVIARILKKEAIWLHGHHFRQWLYVKDAARAILELSRKPPIGEVFNLASKDHHSIFFVARSIMELLGQQVPFIIGPDRPQSEPQYGIDDHKIRQFLPNWHNASFYESLKETVETYQKHEDWLLEQYERWRPWWQNLQTRYARVASRTLMSKESKT